MVTIRFEFIVVVTAILLLQRAGAVSEKYTCSIKLEKGHLFINNEIWMSLGDACLRHDYKEECDAVDFESSARKMEGIDPLGTYNERTATKMKGAWELSHRTYSPSTTMFVQRFMKSLNDTAYPATSDIIAATNGMASWFPSFRFNTTRPKGVLELNGAMMGEKNYRILPLQKLESSNDALQSGPIAIFDDQCVVVMSTASSFMSSSNMLRKDEYGFGVMGSVTHIPQGHSVSVILSSAPRYGPDGIRQAFNSWGMKLQTLYSTKRPSDVTLEYLQWATDAGAYYYYNTEANTTYQVTIKQMKDYADDVGLPFRSWLMDSWWYFRGGVDNGVKNWTARPDVFPDGLRKLQEEINWATVAHNRYWSQETDYAKQNGGNYDFVMENLGLPLTEAFWDDLFATAKQWGLTVYEQDWLNIQTQEMNVTLQTVDAGRKWLLQMGHAAGRHGVTIQYCMSWPRHILQSLEINAVTQARASLDYVPGNDNWQGLGITSILGSALGITPLKDNFWSSNFAQWQPRYKRKLQEPSSRIHAAVATYSTGSVAPSDRIHSMDVELILRSCAQDGKLLRPHVPAVRTDATILAEAGFSQGSGQKGHVWSTFSDLSGFRYTYILAAHSPAFQLDDKDLYSQSTSVRGYVAWILDTPFKPLVLPVNVRATTSTTALVYCVAPIFLNGWAFLGEAETKWTVASRDRFSKLTVTNDGFSVTMIGAPNEVVKIVVLTPVNGFVPVLCLLSALGEAVFDSSQLGAGASNETACKASEKASPRVE